MEVSLEEGGGREKDPDTEGRGSGQGGGKGEKRGEGQKGLWLNFVALNRCGGHNVLLACQNSVGGKEALGTDHWLNGGDKNTSTAEGLRVSLGDFKFEF